MPSHWSLVIFTLMVQSAVGSVWCVQAALFWNGPLRHDPGVSPENRACLESCRHRSDFSGFRFVAGGTGLHLGFENTDIAYGGRP